MDPTDQLIREFQEIHERIFELACRKNKYAAKMSDSLNKAIENALEEEYKTYYCLYRAKLDAAVSIDLYILSAKRDIMVPRRWRNWWSFWKIHTNEAADLADERIASDAKLYYDELMEHLEMLKKEYLERHSGPSEAADALPDEVPAEEAEEAVQSPPEALETPAEAWEEDDDDTVPDEDLAGPA